MEPVDGHWMNTVIKHSSPFQCGFLVFPNGLLRPFLSFLGRAIIWHLLFACQRGFLWCRKSLPANREKGPQCERDMNV